MVGLLSCLSYHSVIVLSVHGSWRTSFRLIYQEYIYVFYYEYNIYSMLHILSISRIHNLFLNYCAHPAPYQLAVLKFETRQGYLQLMPTCCVCHLLSRHGHDTLHSPKTTRNRRIGIYVYRFTLLIILIVIDNYGNWVPNAASNGSLS